jgi:hypothetical protein
MSLWDRKEEINSKNCDKCEHGDYECHTRQCYKMIPGDMMEITSDEWDFIKKLGCGSFEPVYPGNLRNYPKK